MEAMVRGMGEVSIAVCNGPRSTAIAGRDAVLERIAAELRAAGVRCTIVDAGFPSHSALVEPILDEFLASLAGLSPQPTHTPLLSTVTGRFMEGRELGAHYWASNLRQPVEFAAAIDTLAQRGEDLFLEVSPKPALARFVEQCLAHADRGGTVVSSTQRDAPEWESLLEAASALQGAGVPVRLMPSDAELPSPPHVLPVSARTSEALTARVAGFIELLESRSTVGLDDLCYTAACGRSHLEHRVAVVGNTHSELKERLGSVLSLLREQGQASGESPRVAFVFPGQGGQWEGMGRELLESEPVFRHALLACDEEIARHTGWSVARKLAEGALIEERADVAQPVLFSIQVALCRLWESLGVRAVALIGHSMGEVAAAHVSGALSLKDAARLICARSQQLQAVKGQGAMAVVESTSMVLDEALSEWEGRVSLAARNGPRSFALAGEREAVEAIVSDFQARGTFARVLGMDFPVSHCPQVEPAREPLMRELEGLAPGPATIPLYSTTTGTVVRGPELDAQHWVRNLLQPVRFYDQVRALARDGINLFLELGPHPLLGLACEQTLAESRAFGSVLHSLRRGEGQSYLYETLAHLYERGVDVDWAVVQRRGGRIISLPSYPWQRIPCWPEGMKGARSKAPKSAAPEPPEQFRLEQALRASASAPDPSLVEPLLRRYAATILQLAETLIPPEASLKRLGLDSLLAMQLNNRIRVLVQVEVPVSFYIEDRSLRALAQALCSHVRQARARVVNAEDLAAGLEEGSL
jgi:acyl transferase domain-containing protein